MSCQENGNKASNGAAASGGISRIASKVGYALAAATPIGMAVIGTKLGTAAFNKFVLDKWRQKRQEKKALEAWRTSSVGQKAFQKFSAEGLKAKSEYEAAVEPINAAMDRAKDEYKQAKTQWIKQNSGLKTGSIKDAITSPTGQAVIRSIAEGTLNVAGAILSEQQKAGQKRGYYQNNPLHEFADEAIGIKSTAPGGRDIGITAGIEAVQQARKYQNRVSQAIEEAWDASDEGRQAKQTRDETLAKLKTQKRPIKGAYRAKVEALDNRYEKAKAKFLDAYKQQQQQAGIGTGARVHTSASA